MTVAPGLSLSAPTQLTLPVGVVGSAYPSTAVTPAGGVKPYTVSVSGLPKGMTFTAGKVSGIPAVGTNGTPSISIAATDANQQTINTTLTLTINAPANPSPIVTGAPNFPAGIYGASYKYTAVATGGYGKLTWSATSLPAGLTVNSTGVISGKPTALGSQSVALTVKDTAGQTAAVTGSITVMAPAVVIKSSSIPATGMEGAAYSATEVASGGYGALAWSASGLPAGVTLSTSGVISGVPSTGAAGIYSVALTVTDTLGTHASVNGKVVISAAPSCTTLPANATGGLGSKGNIISINGNLITFTYTDVNSGKVITVKVTVPPCATIQWNGGAAAFALGQVFDWSGYNSPANGNVAQIVTIN